MEWPNSCYSIFAHAFLAHRKRFYRMKTKNWSPIYRRIECRWVTNIAVWKMRAHSYFQMEPTPEQIKCAVEHLESEKSASNLWSSIANDLDELIGEPKRSITFWKRTFKRIIKRLTAKRELIEHITRNYVSMQLSSCTLKPMEMRLLQAWMQSKVMNTTNTVWTEPSLPIASSGTSEIENLRSNCRICLASTSSKMTYLFGADDDDCDRVSLLDKLNFCSCLSSEASIDDGFPQFICMSCSVLLESAYQLKLLCAKTEERLTGMQRRMGPQSNRNALDHTTLIPDETSFEVDDDCIVGEVLSKHDEAENDMAQPSHIEWVFHLKMSMVES